jgi:DNA-binding transcriptional MerR regulator
MGGGGVMAEGLLIGQLAALANVTVKTVRHYEKLGLIPVADRESNGYRRYAPEAVLRVVLIRRLRGLGLPLMRIADVLGNDTTRVRRELAMLVDLLAEEHQRLEERLNKLRGLVAELESGADFLSALGGDSVSMLRDALGEHAGRIDDATWELERKVAGLIETFAGTSLADDYGAVLDVMRGDPATFAALLEIDRDLAALREVDPDDPRVAELAARMRAARPALDAIGKLLPAPPAAVLAGMQMTVASKVSAAQRRALQLASSSADGT